MQKKLPYLNYFIGSYIIVIINCHLCYLLFLLYKILTKTKAFITISRYQH